MQSPFPPRRLAFSLLELLVVISIIGLIAVFVIPAATSMVMGTDLTRASQQVSSQFAAARQMAITRNRPIEVRLMKFRDPEVPGEKLEDDKTWHYRAIQLMEILPNGRPVAAGKVERLTGSVVMNDGNYSSLLNDAAESDGQQKKPDEVTADASDPGLPRMADTDARKYKYVKFRYLTDGSTDLKSTGKWYLTLVSGNDDTKLKTAGGGTDAIQRVNYFTLQVDPASGSTRFYRPALSAAKKTGT